MESEAIQCNWDNLPSTEGCLNVNSTCWWSLDEEFTFGLNHWGKPALWAESAANTVQICNKKEKLDLEPSPTFDLFFFIQHQIIERKAENSSARDKK